MISYRINPYISFIESRLFPESVQYAVFHRLTGDLIEPSETVRSFLRATKPGQSILYGELQRMREAGTEINGLIHHEFLITEDHDPLSRVVDEYVVRPIQNPALVYRSKSGDWVLVQTPMEQTVYSRRPDELPPVIEEKLSPMAAHIFLLADGTKTLRDIFSTLDRNGSVDLLNHLEFRAGIDFLTAQQRQLVKFTSRPEDLDQPFTSVNIVPRNLYHSQRWNDPLSPHPTKTIVDFHLKGIEDASWEFDQIEPTVNHSFRFPHEALGGLDYGSRFCVSSLKSEVLPLLAQRRELNVLEVGGGTGSFARSFIQQAMKLKESGEIIELKYHILDLSPTLIANQRRVLSSLLPESQHFQQDATEFDLPAHKFDLIVSNEVIADFPVASVQRNPAGDRGDGEEWFGEGAHYLQKYDLSVIGAPDSFLINAGAFHFLERAWKHLRSGGTLIVSEYGAEKRYPARSFHLNHDEFTIHFGHLSSCATKIGFDCKLISLSDFLELDDNVPVLSGREEHILCLNHVLTDYGISLPFAVISKSDFEQQCQSVVQQIGLTGYSFSPLRNGYHFGPALKDFFVLIMNKP